MNNDFFFLKLENVFPPVMCRRLLPNTVAEGERVVLEIEVAGTPEPSVKWFKNNEPLVFPSSLCRFRQQGTCSAIVIEKGTSKKCGKCSLNTFFFVKTINIIF